VVTPAAADSALGRHHNTSGPRYEQVTYTVPHGKYWKAAWIFAFLAMYWQRKQYWYFTAHRYWSELPPELPVKAAKFAYRDSVSGVYDPDYCKLRHSQAQGSEIVSTHGVVTDSQ
jgi:hypothetical protein